MPSRGLHISSDLTLPINAVTQKFAILGTSGGGKSYTAQKLAELMLDAGAQIVAVDPVGIWWSLRLLADGKRPGYEQVRVFGGDHGDLPLTPESGSLIARILAERRISAVLDVSQFITGEMKRFLTDFAEQFFQSKKRHKSPVHLFLEECQTYIPQDKSDKADPTMLNRWERLIKFFRNYGGGTSMISQQPQSVNKKALNLADTLFAMRTIGSHEREAILKWVKDVVESESELVARLPKLDTGVCHIWSPSWLKISRDIKILPKRTFDAGKTPEMGVDAVEPKPLTPVDVEQLKTEMKEMIEKVKEEDPRLLRQEIMRLKADIRKLSTNPLTAVKEVKVVDQGAIDRAVRDAQIGFKEPMRQRDKLIERLQVQLGGLVHLANQTLQMTKTQMEPVPSVQPRLHQQRPNIEVRIKEPVQMVRVPIPVQRRSQAENNEVKGTPLKMLKALADFEALGRQEVRKAVVASWCGIKATTGTWGTYLSTLTSAGLVQVSQDRQHLKLTESGRAVAGQGEPPTSPEEMLGRCMQIVGGTPAKMLKILFARHPESMSYEDLAAALESPISADTGTWGTYLSTLSSAEMVRKEPGRMVRCSDWVVMV